MTEILIAGCGDIGCRVAARYRDRSAAVTGLVSSAESAARLHAAGITPWLAELDETIAMPSALNVDTLFYFAPPPKAGAGDPRLDAFLSAISAQARPRVLVYISTSGVYGDCGGAWVDESAPLLPRTPRAQRRLAAERCALSWGKRNGVSVRILRVPGIYGPGRLPIERLKRGLPVLRAEDCPYTNRIHADDLANVAVAAAERESDAGVYNVSDGNPTTMTDYFNRVADLCGLPRPRQVTLDEARRELTAEMMSFHGESKRLITRRMRDELGVTPRYPDLASGLPACQRQ